MATVDQDIEQIRTAVFGKDVREAIADGIQQINNIAKKSLILHNDPSTSDLNEVTERGTYLLANSVSYVNSPISQGTPAFLEVILGPNGPTGSAVIQRLTAMYTDKQDTYVRIGRWQGENSRAWSAWRIDSGLWPGHVVLTTQNLNDVTEPGYYMFVNSVQYINNPFSNGYPEYIEVFRAVDQTTIIQKVTIINGGETASKARIGRLYSETYTFTSWEDLTKAANITQDSAGTDSFGRIIPVLSDYTRKYNETNVDMDDEITWESGGINTETGEEVSTLAYYRCDDYYKTNGNEIFVIQYDNFEPSEILSIYFYDNSKNYIKYIESSYEPIWYGDVTYTNNDVQIAPGEGYVRFAVRKRNGTNPVVGVHSSFDFIKNTFGTKASIRIGTHNVRNWGTEFSLGYKGNSLINQNMLKQIYKKSQIDILGIQEFSAWLDNPHVTNSADIILNSFKHIYFATYKQWTPIASQFDLANIEGIDLNSGRWGMMADLSYNDKTIKIINFHASPNGEHWHGDQTRPEEYAEILSIMEDNTYAICTGDFNSTDFSTFTDAGMLCAHNGSSLPGVTIDNIVITPTLKFGDVKVVQEINTSDHRLLWADIIIP